MTPVFLRKLGAWSDLRIDFGAEWKGKPLFGAHKTWRGLVGGTLAGGLIWMGQVWLLNNTDAIDHWYLIDYNELVWWVGFVLGFGAIFGDLVKSFLKRRFGVKSGERWIPWDQVDYLIGGLLAASIFILLPWEVWVIVILFGFFAHFLANRIAYWIKLKNTPW